MMKSPVQVDNRSGRPCMAYQFDPHPSTSSAKVILVEGHDEVEVVLTEVAEDCQ